MDQTQQQSTYSSAKRRPIVLLLAMCAVAALAAWLMFAGSQVLGMLLLAVMGGIFAVLFLTASHPVLMAVGASVSVMLLQILGGFSASLCGLVMLIAALALSYQVRRRAPKTTALVTLSLILGGGFLLLAAVFYALDGGSLAPNDLLDSYNAFFGDLKVEFSTVVHEWVEGIDEKTLALYAQMDITKEMLEIALCAQHNNGGLDVDLWWQTEIPGLFAAGEVAGTHGVYRPGGSALNAGQVGSLRASQYIVRNRAGLPSEQAADTMTYQVERAAEELNALCDKLLANGREQGDNTSALLSEHRADMSACAGAIRNVSAMRALIEKNQALLASFGERVCAVGSIGLARAFSLRDSLITQIAVLSSMIDYVGAGGKSRGSALYTAADGQSAPGLEQEADGLFRYLLDDGARDAVTQTLCYDAAGMNCHATWREVRPLPEGGGFFENVWRSYRENGNVY